MHNMLKQNKTKQFIHCVPVKLYLSKQVRGHICFMGSSLLTPALGHYSPLHGQSQVVVTPGSRKDGQKTEIQGKGFLS